MMATETMTGESLHAWSRLWRAGVLHSCANGISGNYDGAIAAFWREQLEGLPSGACVVDIGTGNGPLALLCKSAADAAGVLWKIHGVDLADINPPSSAPDDPSRYDGIVFHAGISATALPFPDASVDLLVSQYGFEYAPREAALREAIRVIGKRGRAAFVLHSHDSLVSQVTRQQLEACEYLMGSSDIWDRTRSLVDVLGHARTPEQRACLSEDSRAEAARKGFNDSAAALIDMANELKMPQILLNAIQHLRNVLSIADRQGAVAANELLDQSKASLWDEWQRLRHMHAAVLGSADLAALKIYFESAGYNARLTPVDQAKDARMGWALVVGDA